VLGWGVGVVLVGLQLGEFDGVSVGVGVGILDGVGVGR
jgi:hypothetical protein